LILQEDVVKDEDVLTDDEYYNELPTNIRVNEQTMKESSKIIPEIIIDSPTKDDKEMDIKPKMEAKKLIKKIFDLELKKETLLKAHYQY
jgi:hypothetical protein